MSRCLDIIIAHAPWAEGRRESLQCLTDSLDASDHGRRQIMTSLTREHANVWAVRVWRSIAANDEGDDHIGTLVLNDDVEPHPDIVPRAEQLAELLPTRVLSLHSQFPGTKAAAEAGHRLVRCYWPSGPAMVLPRGAAAELLAWLAGDRQGQWFRGATNEDGAIASWLWSKQTPAYGCIPALVRHDTTIPSTLGYDHHAFRMSGVDWDTYPPRLWTEEDVRTAPYVGIPWMGDGELAYLGKVLAGQAEGRPCCFCREEDGRIASNRTRLSLCFSCARQVQKALEDHERAPDLRARCAP